MKEICNNDTYRGLDVTKKLLTTNEKFRKLIVKGLADGTIRGFSLDEWDRMEKLNVKATGDIRDVFRTGNNIGACTTMSKFVSYIFGNCNIVGGTNSYLVETKNSPDGRHTWIEYNEYIYDTTFMLVINKKHAISFGYNMKNSYNPNDDPIYTSAKDFANYKRLA